MHDSRNGFLTREGMELRKELAQREKGLYVFPGMGLTEYAQTVILDSEGSVSGLELERDLYENILDSDIDEQARRFHNGT